MSTAKEYPTKLSIIRFLFQKPAVSKHSLTMRFSTILITSLAALGSAAPNAIARRDNEQITAAIEFAALADGCSILKCAGVIANVACIAAAIVTTPETAGGSVAAALACVKEGVEQVCIGLPTYKPIC